MKPRYADLLERAGRRCEYCHAPSVTFNFPLDIEHIKPRSKEGPKTEDNLAVACRSCNVFKGARTSVFDPETSAFVELFHPRLNRWDDHFEFEIHTMEIRGITAVGKATISALQLNSDEQRFARLQWIRLKLFP